MEFCFLLYICIYVYVCVYVYMYIFCICIYVCACIYAYMGIGDIIFDCFLHLGDTFSFPSSPMSGFVMNFLLE